MRPLAVYSVLRIGLFVVAYVVLRALGAEGLLAPALAAVISLGLSFVLLRRQRESAARALLQRRNARPAEDFAEFLRSDAAAEDAAADDTAAAARSNSAPRHHGAQPAALPDPTDR